MLFADDLGIWCQDGDTEVGMNKMSSTLSDIYDYCTNNELLINYSKTKYMIFHKSNDNNIPTNLSLTINGNQIERVYDFKYLGVLLDQNLNFSSHYISVYYKQVCKYIAICHASQYSQVYISFEMFCATTNAFVYSTIDYCIINWL